MIHPQRASMALIVALVAASGSGQEPCRLTPFPGPAGPIQPELCPDWTVPDRNCRCAVPEDAGPSLGAICSVAPIRVKAACPSGGVSFGEHPGTKVLMVNGSLSDLARQYSRAAQARGVKISGTSLELWFYVGNTLRTVKGNELFATAFSRIGAIWNGLTDLEYMARKAAEQTRDQPPSARANPADDATRLGADLACGEDAVGIGAVYTASAYLQNQAATLLVDGLATGGLADLQVEKDVNAVSAHPTHIVLVPVRNAIRVYVLLRSGGALECKDGRAGGFFRSEDIQKLKDLRSRISGAAR